MVAHGYGDDDWEEEYGTWVAEGNDIDCFIWVNETDGVKDKFEFGSGNVEVGVMFEFEIEEFDING